MTNRALDALVFLGAAGAAAAACRLQVAASLGGAGGAGLAFGLVAVLGRRVAVLVGAALGERDRRVPRLAMVGLVPFAGLALLCVGSAVSEIASRGSLESAVSAAFVAAVLTGLCWLLAVIALK